MSLCDKEQKTVVIQARLNEFIKTIPTPAQEYFLSLDCLEAFFTGPGGCGKTETLLMAALQYVDVPGYHALFLSYRAEMASLLCERIRDLLKMAGKYLPGPPTICFPSGARLMFGHMDHDGKYKYAAMEAQFIGFDELANFDESEYEFIMSRLRRGKNNNVPLRIRSASNPIGRGREWVKKRFVLGSNTNGAICVRGDIQTPWLSTEDRERLLKFVAPEDHKAYLGDWS